MRQTTLANHPQREEIEAALLAGESVAELARRYAVTASSLYSARHRAKVRGDAASTSAKSRRDDNVRVTGGWKSRDVAEFRWDNVSDVPSEEEIRWIISIPGNDPDDFEWWVTRVQFTVSRNSATWHRDEDVAREMAGVKGTAYTAPSEVKRGHVEIKIERKKTAELGALKHLPRIESRPAKYRCAWCATWYNHSRVGPLWCSASCRNNYQVQEAQDHGVIRHVVIPDTQVKPGVPTDHLVWAGRYIREQCAGQRTRIVHLGDHWDMHSLSTYDRGKLAAEGARVKADLEAGNRAFEILDEAMGDDPLWEKHFLFGNHEDRITRYVNEHPELEEFLSLDNCVTPPSWQRHDFLDVLWLDGVAYSHYFYNPNTGKPLGGESIETRLKQVGHSFVMGHQQGLKMGMHYAAGKQRFGLVAGSFYQHDEGYKGPQGNHHWRGIVVLNDVEDGSFDPMPVSLDYLCRRYEGKRIWEHEGIEL